MPSSTNFAMPPFNKANRDILPSISFYVALSIGVSLLNQFQHVIYVRDLAALSWSC